MKETLLVGDAISVANGQLQIILRSRLYGFSGRYTIESYNEVLPSQIRLPFDCLLCVNDYSLLIHPDDQRVVEGLVSYAGAPRATEFKIRLVTPEKSIKVLVAEGEVVDLIEAGMHFRAVMSNTHDVITRWNRELKLVYANPAFEEVTGERAAGLYGKTCREMGQPEEIASPWMDKLAQAFITGETACHYHTVSSAHGAVHYHACIIPEKKAQGVVETVVAVERDVTELRMSEQRHKALNAKLKEFDREKTRFFSHVSHEFRTPLTLLLGPLEDLMRSGSTIPAGDRLKLQMAHRNGLRLQNLVNTLLDFSRVEAGRLETIFQPTDLPRLTADLAGNFRSLIEKGGLEFRVRMAEIREPVYVNHEMWEKIVFNLLSNAFKFTLSGRIEIALREKKKYVKLYVRDTGVGISAENMGKLFTRFSRIENSRARTHDGSGIGLALIKELVSLHGGSIKVKSKEGSGSEFAVLIPKGKAHLPARQIYETRASLRGEGQGLSVRRWEWLDSNNSANLTPAGQPLPVDLWEKSMILVVDDNADMRDYLAGILQADYTVIMTGNGREALEWLESGLRPDLVLADVMMPRVDGLALVRYVKSRAELVNTPILLLTACAGENEKIEGMKFGADDYLIKPFSARALLAVIKTRIRMAADRNKVMQETAERQHLALKMVSDELAHFTHIASHDLREPLRKIHLFSNELIRHEVNLSKQGKDFSDRIIRSVNRMTALIDDMLTFSQASSADLSKPENVDLNHLVQQVLAGLEAYIRENDATVDVNSLPVLKGNFRQLFLLLENLVSNALKFRLPDRPPVVCIEGRFVKGYEIGHPLAEPDARYFKLEVRDNGIGFEQRYADRIFHMFQRLHGKDEFPGTGMGLAICKKIVENHKGFIVGKGELHVGSSFTCYFPV